MPNKNNALLRHIRKAHASSRLAQGGLAARTGRLIDHHDRLKDFPVATTNAPWRLQKRFRRVAGGGSSVRVTPFRGVATLGEEPLLLRAKIRMETGSLIQHPRNLQCELSCSDEPARTCHSVLS